jgi:hypothetical protein
MGTAALGHGRKGSRMSVVVGLFFLVYFTTLLVYSIRNYRSAT